MLTKAQLRRLRQMPFGETGNRIAAAMELLEVTQLEVAAGTGFGQPYISAVSRGVNATISVENAHPFAKYFGCLIEDLFPAKQPLSDKKPAMASAVAS